LAKSVALIFESERGVADGGKGKPSPRIKSETPIAPIAPVRTVCGKYATYSIMSEFTHEVS
jgi:hypothetical protein